MPAVIGLTALLAVPALAGGESGEPARSVGFQAKVLSVGKRSKALRARVLTAGGTGAGGYKGRTMRFDLRGARLTVADTNGDGRANTVADISRGDIVGVTGTVPARRRRVVTVETLTDVTALLPTQNVPGTPVLPRLPGTTG